MAVALIAGTSGPTALRVLTAAALAAVTVIGFALALNWRGFSDRVADYFRDAEYLSVRGTWSTWSATPEQFRLIGLVVAVAATIGVPLALAAGH